jgi:hypothetical protein
MWNMTDIERGKCMEEIRQMREDIKSELAIGRQENREDIKDLHSKIDKRFFMLNEKFDVISKDVTTHKAHLKPLWQWS